MQHKSNHPNVSRLNFLRNSGLVAAALIARPGLGFAAFDETGAVYLKEYTLVVPAPASVLENTAAQQLQDYLFQMSGVKLNVVEERSFRGKKAIYIGQTAYAKAHVDFAKIKTDGYVYKSIKNHFIIAGGERKGLLYGVYDLLEAIGFKKFTPDYSYIPKTKKTVFPADKEILQPKVTYRTSSYSKMGGQELLDWHKVSSRNDDWGLFVHTFNNLLSPEEYGSSHPEYFSLRNNKRVPGTQLCLSNAAVVDIVIINLKKRIAEKPHPVYWSVSQNDNDQYCQCEVCTALNKKYGDVPSGSVIYFVNQVAKAFPGKIISTLAYWYTRKAPVNIRPEPNVNIMLCNIESLRQAPVYETDPAFSNDLKDWGKLTNDILIWDYNVQFTNYIAPFPNLFTIKPNIKFYTEQHVNALFMQANDEIAGEMALLRAYLIYKLMWNPDADDNAIIDEFVNGYYGAAAPFIRQYINSLHKALAESGAQLSIFGDPIDAKESFLSFKNLATYKEQFDLAENAVRADDEILRRVQVARLPVMYAEIQIGRTEVDTARSMFHRSDKGYTLPKPEFRLLVNQFVEWCKREGVKLIRERSGTADHYLASYNRIFANMDLTASVKSFNKKITAITAPASNSKGAEKLTDGMFASYEAWQGGDKNWIFYEGEHMDFVLDLGVVQSVSMINMDFLNAQAQPDWHLMALPKYLSYSLSADGEKYEAPVQVNNPHNPNPFENPGISKISIHSFRASIKADARYIKVHAESLLKMPSWHIRAGGAARIYTDQIVVM